MITGWGCCWCWDAAEVGEIVLKGSAETARHRAQGLRWHCRVPHTRSLLHVSYKTAELTVLLCS